MAKFPFEEVPVSKQGGKYEGCPPSAVSNPTLAAPHTAALDTGVQSGKDPQLLLFLSTTLGHRQTSRPGCFSVCYAFVSKPLPRYSPAGSRRKTNDQQLQDINEVVEEAELAQTMIDPQPHSEFCFTYCYLHQKCDREQQQHLKSPAQGQEHPSTGQVWTLTSLEINFQNGKVYLYFFSDAWSNSFLF